MNIAFWPEIWTKIIWNDSGRWSTIFRLSKIQLFQSIIYINQADQSTGEHALSAVQSRIQTNESIFHKVESNLFTRVLTCNWAFNLLSIVLKVTLGF